jgi:hypothetical protein
MGGWALRRAFGPGCLLDEIAREGARRMLVVALETEVAAYLEAHRDERDDDGHALVVRNGKGRTRKVTVGSGTITASHIVSSRRAGPSPSSISRTRRSSYEDSAPTRTAPSP